MIPARDATLFQKGWPVSTRVFKTQRGRITLTDQTLTYERELGVQQRFSVARNEIIAVYLAVHAFWFSPSWTEVLVRHHGGTLSIPYVGDRTARALRKALGF